MQIIAQPEATVERQVTACKSILVCTGIYSQLPQVSVSAANYLLKIGCQGVAVTFYEVNVRRYVA